MVKADTYSAGTCPIGISVKGEKGSTCKTRGKRRNDTKRTKKGCCDHCGRRNTKTRCVCFVKGPRGARGPGPTGSQDQLVLQDQLVPPHPLF